MAKRLLILYSAAPDPRLVETVGPDDVVLTDQVISLPGRRIDLAAEPIDDDALIACLRRVAEGMAGGDGPSPNAFINNLYTCSVAPLFRLVAALKRILDEGPVAEVVFESGASAPFFSTYYMAEHESQGIRWYDRGAFFTPYAVRYLEERGVPFIIDRPTSAWRARWNGFVRVQAVLWGKMIKGLVTRPVPPSPPVSSDEPDLLITTRTRVQTEFFLNYLPKSRFRSRFLLFESLLAHGENRRYADSRIGDFSFVSVGSAGDKLRLVGATLAAFLALFRLCRPVILEHDGVRLDLKNAFREVTAMTPDLKVYQASLDRAVAAHCAPRTRALLTAEMKSGQAWAEAAVARRHGLKHFQFMPVDLTAEPIPSPVVGEAFVVDSRETLDRMKALFPEAPFVYAGTVKGMRFVKPPVTKREGLTVCYFTNPKFVDDNRELIRTLVATLRPQGHRVMVKLHPRDVAALYADLDGAELIPHAATDTDRLLAAIDIAVTGMSGIATDLIMAAVPLVPVLYTTDARAARPHYAEADNPNVCMDAVGLARLMADPGAVIDRFYPWREGALARWGIVVDPAAMDAMIARIVG